MRLSVKHSSGNFIFNFPLTEKFRIDFSRYSFFYSCRMHQRNFKRLKGRGRNSLSSLCEHFFCSSKWKTCSFFSSTIAASHKVSANAVSWLLACLSLQMNATSCSLESHQSRVNSQSHQEKQNRTLRAKEGYDVQPLWDGKL